MRSPRDFTKPLAMGAPQPVLEIPIKPSRCIHFFDPSNLKMAAKLPELARQTDILLGNLEDAIPADRKIDAREGLVKIGREVDFGATPLWTRVNSLDSPWFLDDVMRLVGEIGDRVEVIMIPKVEGPWDIHYRDRLPALLRSLRRHLGSAWLRGSVPGGLPARLRRRVVAPSEPDRHRKAGLQSAGGRGDLRQARPRCHAGRPGRPHARRQDAGR